MSTTQIVSSSRLRPAVVSALKRVQITKPLRNLALSIQIMDSDDVRGLGVHDKVFLKGLISDVVRGALLTGELATESDFIFPMDQSARMHCALDELRKFTESAVFAEGNFGFSTAQAIISRSIMAAGGSTNYNFPFNISVFRHNTSSNTLSIVASNTCNDPLQTLYPGDPSTRIRGAVETVVKESLRTELFAMEVQNNGQPFMDRELVDAFKNMGGPANLYLIPLWHRNQFQGMISIHRMFPVNDETKDFIPQKFATQWTSFNELKANMMAWADSIAQVLGKARQYEVNSRPFSAERYLPPGPSRLVNYAGCTVEIIENPYQTLGVMRERVVNDLTVFLEAMHGVDMKHSVESIYVGKKAKQLLIARRDTRLVAFSSGIEISQQGTEIIEKPILYIAGTYVDPSVRGRLLHVFMNGLFVYAHPKPFWVVVRTPVPQVYDSLSTFASDVFPRKGDMPDDVSFSEARWAIKSTAEQLGFRVDGFRAFDTVPDGMKIDTSKGDPGTIALFDRLLPDRWENGAPKDAMMIAAYMGPDTDTNYYDGITMREIWQKGRRRP